MAGYFDDLPELVKIPRGLKLSHFRLGLEWGATWAAHLGVDPRYPNDVQRTEFRTLLDGFAATFDHIFGRDQELVTRRRNLCQEALEAWHRAYNTVVSDEAGESHVLPIFHGNAASIYCDLTGLEWNAEWGDPHGMPATPQLEALRTMAVDALAKIGGEHAAYMDLGTMAAFCWMALYLDAERANAVFRVFEEKAMAAGFLEDRLFRRRERVGPGTLQVAFDVIRGSAAELPEIERELGNDPEPAGMMSAKQLAKHFKVPHEALRKLLERYRKKNLNGWLEVENRGPNESRYIYDPETLGPEVRRTYPSVRRPAGQNLC